MSYEADKEGEKTAILAVRNAFPAEMRRQSRTDRKIIHKMCIFVFEFEI